MNNNFNTLNNIFEDTFNYKKLKNIYDKFDKEVIKCKKEYQKKQDIFLGNKKKINKNAELTIEDRNEIWKGFDEDYKKFKIKYYGSINNFNKATKITCR